MLRIHEIKLRPGEKTEELPAAIEKKLERLHASVSDCRIVKESIDARHKNDIKRVYTVDFHAEEPAEEQLLTAALKLKNVKLEKAPDMSYSFVTPGDKPLASRPVIAGFGPCGIFAALLLSQMGYAPIVLERGKTIEERALDVEAFWSSGKLNAQSNVQFGEGGAGTFSDGKLTTQIKDPRVRKVLCDFAAAGASEDILYRQKPHIGTDVLRRVIVNMRNKIIENGGEVRFESRLTDVEVTGGKLSGIVINGAERIETDLLVLALGHSARDTFRMLLEGGVPMEQKPFSIGVRIEHKQQMINETQLGSHWQETGLGAADYKLSCRCGDGRGVYTFCMCPGGYVVASASQEGGVVTNGMSFRDRGAENANSALLVDVKTDDFGSEDPLAGVAFQEKYERLAFQAGGEDYKAPAQRLGAFMGTGGTDGPKGLDASSPQPTYKPGVKWAELSECLPAFAVRAMKEALPQLGRKLKGFDSCDAVLTGVETRSSSPVRILRDEGCMSEIKGIYPAGEGAGYAGGIMSAAVDGIKTAEAIAGEYRPIRAEDRA